MAQGKRTPITSVQLNDAERGTLALLLDTIRRAEEAKTMFRTILSGIVTRAGGTTDPSGEWDLSSDLQRAEFRPKGKQNGD